MASLELWKLSVDIALMVGLAYIAYRFIRGDASPIDRAFLRELESSLKSLIGDAEHAGRSLSVELNRRKQSLMQTLTELESMDQQVTETIKVAQKKKIEIDEALLAVRYKAQNLQSESSLKDRDSGVITSSLSRKQSSNQSRLEPSSFAEPKHINNNQKLSSKIEVVSDQESISKNLSHPDSAETELEEDIKWSNRNIFGEVLQTDKAISNTEFQTIAVTPEPQKVNRAELGSKARATIKEVYLKAEELLRRGQGLAQVAARTNLPITEVKILSNLIQKEQQRHEESKPSYLKESAEKERSSLDSDLIEPEVLDQTVQDEQDQEQFNKRALQGNADRSSVQRKNPLLMRREVQTV